MWWVVFGVVEPMLVEWAESKAGGIPDRDGTKPPWLKRKVLPRMYRSYASMSICPRPGKSIDRPGGGNYGEYPP